MQHKLDGVVIIDKPATQSSAKVLADVKSLYQVAKAGHSGTLDPFATGVLVCCLNQATRLSRFFLHDRKTYEAVVRLGVETDTQDTTGSPIRRAPVPRFSESHVKNVLARFEGRQMQQPPIYSALKHRGTPLYKLARQGKPIQKPPRSVTIFKIALMDLVLPDMRLSVECSAGTYIRTLCTDIGKALGCGGHLTGLRRTVSSGFAIGEAIPLDDLRSMGLQQRSDRLISMADALRKMPSVTADDELCRRVAHGRPLSAADLPAAALAGTPAQGSTGWVKIVDRDNRLKAVIEPMPDGHYNYGCVLNQSIAEFF